MPSIKNKRNLVYGPYNGNLNYIPFKKLASTEKPHACGNGA
jgi:hypothetical protein